jgi:NAD(P)-dependent dehydrogenase (short-subunit alcohol dehydrogenase family)
MSSQPRFAGRVALVTGAGRGIGRAVALALANEGAAIAALDVDQAGIEETVAEIERGGGRAITTPGDVRDEGDVAAAVRKAVVTHGGLDLLANIAGVLRTVPVVDCDEETWDFVLDINLKGSFLCCKHAIPEMRRRGGGAIVNTASVLAFAANEGTAAYSASKSAVIALTMATALEHGRDAIRVNCIAPGSSNTPLLHEAAAELGDDTAATLEEWGRLHPLPGLIDPADVASLVAFLLSEDAAAISGSTYRVDRGWLSKLPG